jgi:hypothetical protein
MKQIPYRMIILNHVGGLLVPPVDCTYANDVEALEFARARLNGHVVEVWQEGRLVRRLMPRCDGIPPTQPRSSSDASACLSEWSPNAPGARLSPDWRRGSP